MVLAGSGDVSISLLIVGFHEPSLLNELGLLVRLAAILLHLVLPTSMLVEWALDALHKSVVLFLLISIKLRVLATHACIQLLTVEV